MDFCLSGKVVTLHLDNNTAKAYLYNQGITISSFLSKLGFHILILADNYGITLIPAYICTHLNVKADYLSEGRLIPEWHLLPCIVQVVFQLGINWRWTSWHPHILINASIIALWITLYLWESWK